MSTISAKQFALAFAMCESAAAGQPAAAPERSSSSSAAPSSAAAATPPAGPTAKPEFKKYALMVKMHLPRGAVEQKMRAEGHDEPAIVALLSSLGV